MSLGKRIKKARLAKELTQKQLAELLNVTDATINRYEKDLRKPDPQMLKAIADVLGVSVDYLLNGEEGKVTQPISNVQPVDMVMLPILANIRAGRPLFAEEHLQGYMPFPKEMLTKGYEHFLLRVDGDSMIGDGIEDGDIVLIRAQNYVDYDGQIVAVTINGNEACLKHLHHPANSNMVILRSSNPKYADIVHPANDVIINGVYMGLFKQPRNNRNNGRMIT